MVVILLVCVIAWGCFLTNGETRNIPSTSIRVHVVAHSHDDVGWLKTPEQYYYGLNNSIQHAEVRLIYDSVIGALEYFPERKFSVVEIFFFSKWYYEQSQEKQKLVKQLVLRGQLVFVGGGWVMNDEATPLYVDVIDQMSLGHAFLIKEFGVAPTVAFQLDPFGSSAAQVVLMSQRAGFNVTYHSRIDYQDFSHRQWRQEREFLWAPSLSLGGNAAVFASSMLHSTYCPQYTMNFDILLETDSIACSSEDTSNVGACAANAAKNKESWMARLTSLLVSDFVVSRGNDIMMTMGCDFTYMQARKWFDSLDEIIKMLNEGPASSGLRFHAFYSTPAEYARAKAQELFSAGNHGGFSSTISKPAVKVGDFFPYADGPHMFWTGYYTSRPSYKRHVRQASAVYSALRVLRAMQVVSRSVWKGPDGTGQGMGPRDIADLSALASALGVAQHHDAITGTAKQHVSNEYSARLATGLDFAIRNISNALLEQGFTALPIFFCPRANISLCPEVGQQHDMQLLAVFNPSARPALGTVLRIPVPSPSVVARDSAGRVLPSVVYCRSKATADYGNQHPDPRKREIGTHDFELALQVNLSGFAALGVHLQYFHASHPSTPSPPVSVLESGAVENDAIKLSFGPDGRLTAITNKHIGLTRNVSQSWCAYRSNTGDTTSWQSSGAYIFRPESGDPVCVDKPDEMRVVAAANAHVTIIEQDFLPWITQRLILTAGQPSMEVEFVVGPVPVDEGRKVGTEVVMRWTSDIASGTEFFTDSNGLEFMKRSRDVRETYPFDQTEPVAGNYYPVVTAAAIADGTAQLTVGVDASVGASSIRSGELELMVHRVTLMDDRRGVAEPLNETSHTVPYTNCEWRRELRGAHPEEQCGAHSGEKLVVKGTFTVTLEAPSSTKWRRRAEAQYRRPLWFPLQVSDTTDSYVGALRLITRKWKLEINSAALPDAIEIVSLDARNSSEVIVRIAHTGTCSSKSECQQLLEVVHIRSLLPFARFIEEWSLTATMKLSELRESLRTDWENALPDEFQRPQGGYNATDSSALLYPQEILTVVIHLA